MTFEQLKIAGNPDLDKTAFPLPLSVIPNHLGINLCNVEDMTLVRQDDGQLVSLTINFNPDTSPN